MKIILLGAPGAGKGTLAQNLKTDYGYAHISTGDILRENIAQKTKIGLQAKKLIEKGSLVPDEMIVKLLIEKINSLKTDDYIIDGFPRTLAQAKSLDKILKVDYVLSLKSSHEVVIDRLLNRLTCPNCKTITNRKWLKDDVCPKCHTKLDLRLDDNEEAIRKRLEIYDENFKTILDFYKKLNILYEIQADETPEKTYDLTKKIIRVKYDCQEK
ncbi:MAG: nucleoside monophosphate kinase [Clostridia bacterium]|nr:nucleoside monophosphate kinase [Clostridia bacterium]